jgi:hypothetical protein
MYSFYCSSRVALKLIIHFIEEITLVKTKITINNTIHRIAIRVYTYGVITLNCGDSGDAGVREGMQRSGTVFRGGSVSVCGNESGRYVLRRKGLETSTSRVLVGSGPGCPGCFWPDYGRVLGTF